MRWNLDFAAVLSFVRGKIAGPDVQLRAAIPMIDDLKTCWMPTWTQRNESTILVLFESSFCLYFENVNH